MGKRVHVVSKQEQYGSFETFNWQQEEFKTLLTSLDCLVHEVCEEYSTDRWEVLKDEYMKAIKYLREYKESGNIIGIDVEDIENAIDNLGHWYKEDLTRLIDVMETYLKESDKNSDWMIFVAY